MSLTIQMDTLFVMVQKFINFIVKEFSCLRLQPLIYVFLQFYDVIKALRCEQDFMFGKKVVCARSDLYNRWSPSFHWKWFKNSRLRMIIVGRTLSSRNKLNFIRHLFWIVLLNISIFYSVSIYLTKLSKISMYLLNTI